MAVSVIFLVQLVFVVAVGVVKVVWDLLFVEAALAVSVVEAEFIQAGLALQVVLVQVVLAVQVELEVFQVVWVIQAGAAKAVGQGWLVAVGQVSSSVYSYL